MQRVTPLFETRPGGKKKEKKSAEELTNRGRCPSLQMRRLAVLWFYGARMPRDALFMFMIVTDFTDVTGFFPRLLQQSCMDI